MITAAIVSFLNINHLLPILISQYGSLVYLGLFMIIFIETGLVFFPFLPGDSLLFLSGSIAALTDHSLNVFILLILLGIAAVIGDTVNFEIGKRFGNYLTTNEKWRRRIKPSHLQQAKDFFEKHGSSAIFLGRFVPIVRTLVPFVAGSSEMKYRQFISFNLLGGFSWVLIAVLSGYFFGNIPFVQSHFELIMVAIVLISLIPVMIISLRNKIKTKVGSVKN